MKRWPSPAVMPIWLVTVCALALAGCSTLRLPAIDPTGERIFLPSGNYTTLVPPSPVPFTPQPAYTTPAPPPPCPAWETPPVPTSPPTGPVPAVPGPSCGAPEPSCAVPEPSCAVPEPSCAAPQAPSCGAPEPPTCAAPQGPSCAAAQPPAAAPAAPPVAAPRRGLCHRGRQGRLLLAPVRLMAPVGTEVVLVSGLFGERGTFVSRQPIEWMLAPDSVGHFVDAGDRNLRLKRIFHQASNKRSGSYAVTRSSAKPELLTRGTSNPADDVTVLEGQSWISITSPTEGTSHVSVLAPEAENWDQRRQTATIYWVDVQWALPAPAVVLAAQPHTLSTTVRRASGKPLPDWIVRYEIVSADVTSFGPDKPGAVDVTTDQNGLASVNLVPANKSGSTQVSIKIIRPSMPDDDLPQMVVGQGYTTVTWSAPDPQVTLYGPESAGIGSTVTYRAEITNAGDVTARQVVANTLIPPNMTFLQSDPPAKVIGNTLSWDLGDLAPRAARQLTISCRPERNATVRFCVRVASADQIQQQQLTAEACVNTYVFTSALGIKVTGPESAEVGRQITFNIQVTNTGYEPLSEVAIRDRLPVGLEHPTQRGNLIERILSEPLQPGESRTIAVELLVRQTGRLCHTVEAVAEGGHVATATACVNGVEPPPPPEPEPQPAVEVAIGGPREGRVGDLLTYTTRVTNTGNTPLTNVRIVNTYDAGLRPREASNGFDLNALRRGEVLWMVDRLMPGETATRESKFECVQENDAAWCRAFVETAEGIRSVKEAATSIKPARRAPVGPTEPPPRIPQPREPEPQEIFGELKVSIADRQDPIPINTTTTYIVAIENGRNVPDKNVAMTILLPPGMEFVKINGPVGARGISQDGRTVEVTEVKEVRAGEQLNPFYIEVRGVSIGKHVVTVRVDSFRSAQPVEAQEETTVNIAG